MVDLVLQAWAGFLLSDQVSFPLFLFNDWWSSLQYSMNSHTWVQVKYHISKGMTHRSFTTIIAEVRPPKFDVLFSDQHFDDPQSKEWSIKAISRGKFEAESNILEEQTENIFREV